jgi:hypothetical protein
MKQVSKTFSARLSASLSQGDFRSISNRNPVGTRQDEVDNPKRIALQQYYGFLKIVNVRI